MLDLAAGDPVDGAPGLRAGGDTMHMVSRRAGMTALFLVGLLSGLPGVAASDSGGQASATAERLERYREEQRREEAQESVWRERHRAALARVDVARGKSERALEGYTRAQEPGLEHGGDDAVARRDVAERELEEAEAALEDFLEEARRAGVPPGWLRADEP